MVKLITKLTWDIVKNYSDRKEEGLIALIVNTNTGEIYPVPRDIEHVDFACRLLDIEKKELARNPNLASHLVPSSINIDQNGRVNGIITGVSGLELGFGVKHTAEALEKAHAMAHIFVNEGKVPVGKLEVNKIIYKFLKR